MIESDLRFPVSLSHVLSLFRNRPPSTPDTVILNHNLSCERQNRKPLSLFTKTLTTTVVAKAMVPESRLEEI